MTKITKSFLAAACVMLFSAGVSAPVSAAPAPPTREELGEVMKAQNFVQAMKARRMSLDNMAIYVRMHRMPLKAFIVAAKLSGFSVAQIATAVLTSGFPPADALKTFGDVFASDTGALSTVFFTAITLPSIRLKPEAVESSLEAGCGKDCLPASLVASLTAPTLLRPQQPLTPTSSFTSTTNTGSGSGPKRSISPTS